jgi:hypothetical protein
VLLRHGQERLGFAPGPGIDDRDLGVLPARHAGDQAADAVRRIPEDQPVAGGQVQHAAQDGERRQDRRRLLPRVELPPDVLEEVRFRDLAQVPIAEVWHEVIVEDRERGLIEARLEGDRVEPVPVPGSGAEQDRLGCRLGLVRGRELAEGELRVDLRRDLLGGLLVGLAGSDPPVALLAVVVRSQPPRVAIPDHLRAHRARLRAR